MIQSTLLQKLAFLSALTYLNLKGATVSWGHSWHRLAVFCCTNAHHCPGLVVQVQEELSFSCLSHRGTKCSEPLQK